MGTESSHEKIYLHKPKFINCETNNGGTVYDEFNRGAITINNSVLPKKVEVKMHIFIMISLSYEIFYNHDYIALHCIP